MEDNIRKSIGFGQTEQDIKKFAERYCEENNIKFATFVKQLIRDKMNQRSEEDKLEKLVEEKIEKVLKNKKVILETSEKTASVEFDDEDRAAVLSFMKK